MVVTAERSKAAVQSMCRVRASESPPGADGLKSVWHQGGEGADLISTVDAQGRVVRQELTLFEDHLLWRAEIGISTGTVRADKAAGGIKGSDLVQLDPKLDRGRLERMDEALRDYAGEDRYLAHVKRLVANALAGLTEFAADEVTSAASPPAAPPPQERGGGKWIALGVAAALAVTLVAYLLLR